MQQTLLAVLALMLVASQTLVQYRGAARVYNKLIDDELEVAAGGVALHIMELIAHRAFDARTLPDEIDAGGLPAGSDQFTAPGSFGKQSGCDLDEPYLDADLCLDIDDVHMAQGEWQEVPFRLKDGKQLLFEVRTEVSYVDADNLDQPLPGSQTSQYKKVVVKVRTQRHVIQNKHVDGFVRLERVYSYNRNRAENRYLDEYPDGEALEPSGPDDD